jgi:hypothetical protein
MRIARSSEALVVVIVAEDEHDIGTAFHRSVELGDSGSGE